MCTFVAKIRNCAAPQRSRPHSKSKMRNILKYKELPPPIASQQDSIEGGSTARHTSPAARGILSRVGRAFRMYMARRRTRKIQDRIARDYAQHHGLLREYKTARRYLTPLEALEEWDLLTPQLRELMCEVEEIKR